MIGVLMPASNQASMPSRTLVFEPNSVVSREPTIREALRHFVGFAARERRFDGFHLFDVAGFFPVVAIVRQHRVTRQRASIHRFCRFFVVADARRESCCR